MKKLTASEYRDFIRDHFNEETDTPDEELQADLDDFFDEEAAKIYEAMHPEEVKATRMFLTAALLAFG